MRELGTLSPPEAARVGSQVAAALAAAHALGIVHRDVKPGNVLIGDDGTARICDFGISRSYGDTTLTMTGMITGTPAYLAPESARGQQSTSPLTCTPWAPPCTPRSRACPPPAPRATPSPCSTEWRPGSCDRRTSGPVGPLLMAMMSADPSDRPSMAEAAAQLSALAGGGATPQLVPGPMRWTPPSGCLRRSRPPPPRADPAPATRRAARGRDPAGAADGQATPLPSAGTDSAGTDSTASESSGTDSSGTESSAVPTGSRRRPARLVGAIVIMAVLALVGGRAAVAEPAAVDSGLGSQPGRHDQRRSASESPSAARPTARPVHRPTAELTQR